MVNKSLKIKDSFFESTSRFILPCVLQKLNLLDVILIHNTNLLLNLNILTVDIFRVIYLNSSIILSWITSFSSLN